MKPDTRSAMRQLIEQVRAAIPFDRAGVELCAEDCNGCSSKLMDYLESELERWELRLNQGATPNFGDLKRLAKTAKSVVGVLDRNGIRLASGSTDH